MSRTRQPKGRGNMDGCLSFKRSLKNGKGCWNLNLTRRGSFSSASLALFLFFFGSPLSLSLSSQNDLLSLSLSSPQTSPLSLRFFPPNLVFKKASPSQHRVTSWFMTSLPRHPINYIVVCAIIVGPFLWLL